MSIRWSAPEIACIKKMAELVESGRDRISAKVRDVYEDYWREDPLGLTLEQRKTILTRMEQMGLIDNVGQAATFPFFEFRITFKAVLAAREIQEEETRKAEPRDIVAEIKDTAKGNRIVAWLIIGFFVLTALVALLNGVLQLLERFGVIDVVKK